MEPRKDNYSASRSKQSLVSRNFSKLKRSLNNKKFLAVALVLILLVGLVVFGLLFNKDESKSSTKTNESSLNGKLKSTSGLSDGTNSAACNLFNDEDLNKIFSIELIKKQGFIDSETDQLKSSSCILIEKEPKNELVVSMLLRDYSSEDDSKKALKGLKDNYSGEMKELKLGKDDYFYNVQSNQLTVLNRAKLITITINTEDSKFNKQEALTSLSNLDW
jgi:hypothetical protein